MVPCISWGGGGGGENREMSSVLLQRGPYEGSLQPPGQCQPTLLPSAGRTLSDPHECYTPPDCHPMDSLSSS